MMADQKHIKIKYRPREQFRPFHSRKQRWSVLVCPRRAGKTVATLNDLIRGAVNECKPEGRYAFIFPQRNQAKDTAWRYLRRYAEPLLAQTAQRIRTSRRSRQWLNDSSLRRRQSRCVTRPLFGRRRPRRVCRYEAGGLA